MKHATVRQVVSQSDVNPLVCLMGDDPIGQGSVRLDYWLCKPGAEYQVWYVTSAGWWSSWGPWSMWCELRGVAPELAALVEAACET